MAIVQLKKFSKLLFCLIILVLTIPVIAMGKPQEPPGKPSENPGVGKGSPENPGLGKGVQECLDLKRLEVGDLYGGGIVFYLDPDKRFGLIAALQDAGQATWWPQFDWDAPIATAAHYVGIGEGMLNTAIIIASAKVNGLASLDYAAKLADNYEANSQGHPWCLEGEICYRDWYLPSRDELEMLIGFVDGLIVYENGGWWWNAWWSSTEAELEDAPARTAYNSTFSERNDGTVFDYITFDLKSSSTSVRPIRAIWY